MQTLYLTEWAINNIGVQACGYAEYLAQNSKPKGALHVHDGNVQMENLFCKVFDLKHNEIFWCPVDLIWITGLAYGVTAPM